MKPVRLRSSWPSLTRVLRGYRPRNAILLLCWLRFALTNLTESSPSRYNSPLRAAACLAFLPTPGVAALAAPKSKERIMAVQQNKKSPSKRGMHRAHNALVVPGLAVESTTGETHLRHHISPNGFYRGRQVLKT